MLLISMLSGFLYCCGGREKDSNEMPFVPKFLFRGFVRDIGCPLCSVLAATLIFREFSPTKLIFIFAMQFLACRSYFTWLNKAFKQPVDKVWYNWLCVGIVGSLKWLILGTINPYLLIIKAVLVTIASETISDAVSEEFFRGFLLT